MISTNLCVPKTRVYRLLDHVEHLFVSIDGLGEYNAQTRGVDGDKLFSRFQRLVVERNRRASKTRLHTATCVHSGNFEHVPTLLQRLHDTDPYAEMVVIPIEPYDDPRSLARSPDAMTAFLHMMEDLKKRFPVSMSRQFNTDLVDDAGTHERRTDNPKDMPRHRCVRQFFRLVIDADGREITCKPSRPIVFYSSRLQQATSIKEMIMLAGSMLHDLFVKPCSAVCRMPCCASEFLDEVIDATSVDLLPRELCMFENGFTAREVEMAGRFIRDKLNSQWPRALEQRLICCEDRKN